MVLQFSGKNSVFGVVNRLLPNWLGIWFLATFTGRARESIFPAIYDHCSYSEITAALGGLDARVIPRFMGALYFGSLPILQEAYLAFEESMVRGGHWDLATHYIVVARKTG
jgi:hypothetical protein